MLVYQDTSIYSYLYIYLFLFNINLYSYESKQNRKAAYTFTTVSKAIMTDSLTGPVYFDAEPQINIGQKVHIRGPNNHLS